MPKSNYPTHCRAQVVWAYATVGLRHERCFAATVACSLRALDGFNAQNLSNTIWAYARSEFYSPNLIAAIAARTARSRRPVSFLRTRPFLTETDMRRAGVQTPRV